MFPEISQRVKAWWADRRESAPVTTLDIDRKAVTVDGLLRPPEWYVRRGFYGLADSVGEGGGPAWSGETVALDTALNHSVVLTCKRILAESTGFLPLFMMQKKNEEKRFAEEQPMYSGLQNAVNDEMSAQQFRELLTGHCVLGGNAFAQIFRRSAQPQRAYELGFLMPSQVKVVRDSQRRLAYVVKDGNSAEKTYSVERGKPQDILHIPGIGWDGLQGYSILRLARHSIGTGLAAERNVASFFARGGRLPYVLKMKQPFADDTQFQRFRDDWERVYAEPHKAPILEPYIEEYKQIGLNAVDSQLLETRQFTVPEICRWFRISPHLAGDLSRATFSNIEQLALEFVNFTLHVWLRRWEQQLWRCVLTPEEKVDGYYFRHNVNALLRGDFKTRMEGYSIALQNGFMSQNEVRDLEDWNGFEGGQYYHVQLNMATLPPGPPPAAQPATRVKIGEGKMRTVSSSSAKPVRSEKQTVPFLNGHGASHGIAELNESLSIH